MTTTSDIRPRHRGPKLPELALTNDERATLERWARRATSSQALALRCRIVLACAEGATNTAVAERLGLARPTVTNGHQMALAVCGPSAGRLGRRAAAGRGPQAHR